MLFVAAAGNDGGNNDTVASYPANYNAPNVIAVAATDNRDQLATYSNDGATTVELGAPGHYIASTIRNNGYAYYSGTSMAAPHVSGAAALILSACSSLDTARLRDVIVNTVDPVAALAGKTMTGGRLNVLSALNACVAPPAAPTGLSATLVGSQVNLTWADNSSNESGFRIERATSGGAWLGIGTVGTNATTYTDATAPPSTQCSYRVFAYNAAGHSVSASNIVTVGAPLVIHSLTADRVFPFAANGVTAISWSAATAGGTAPLRYLFRVYDYTTARWAVLRAYSPSSTFNWTPTPANPGTYYMQVWVLNAGSSAAYDAVLGFGPFCIASGPLAVTSLIPNRTFPFAADGTADISWTAATTGGVAPLRYLFRVYDYVTAKWTVLRAYSSTSSCNWTPGPADAGTYYMQVWVVNAGSLAPYDAVLGYGPFTLR